MCVSGKPFQSGLVFRDKHSGLLRKSVNYGQNIFITLVPGACIIKLITTVIYSFRNKLDRVFVTGKPLQSGLVFRDKHSGLLRKP